MFEKLLSILGKSSVSFQILSDLHLELNQQYSSFEIPVCAKYLILAGDIGRLVDYDNYRDFVQKQTDRFELVFLVLGNHEFYTDTFVAGLQRARQLEQEPCLDRRLILLHQGRYDIPGSHVTILGCTLWSQVPEKSREPVTLTIQDFKHIQDWTIDSHNESHESDLTWLLSEMESIQNSNNLQKKNDLSSSSRIMPHPSKAHRARNMRTTLGAPPLGRISSRRSPGQVASKPGYLVTHTTLRNLAIGGY